MSLDLIIKEKYEELKEKDIGISYNEFINYQYQEKPYIYLVTIDNVTTQFFTWEECFDYLNSIEYDNLNIKAMLSESYYIEEIVKDLLNLDSFTDEEIIKMINLFYDDVDGKTNVSDAIKTIYNIIKENDDLINEFYENQRFAYIICVHYAYSVVKTLEEDTYVSDYINNIISLEYYNKTNQAFYRLKHYFDTSSITIKKIFARVILNSKELNNNQEYKTNYLGFFTPEEIKYDFIFQDSFDDIMKIYINVLNKELHKNNNQIYTITQLARRMIEEYYSFVSDANNFSNSVRLLGIYLTNKDIFMNYDMEMQIKKVAISLMIMTYYIDSKGINRDFIENHSVNECIDYFKNNDDFQNLVLKKYLTCKNKLDYLDFQIPNKYKILAKIEKPYIRTI